MVTEALVPYEGAEPYVFISYAHADAEAVLAVAGRLQQAASGRSISPPISRARP